MKERTNQHSCRSFLNKKKAFTLVELLVVIAIIGILFVVLISKVDFATDNAKAKGVQTDFRSYQLALKTVGMEQQGFSNDMDLLAEQLNKNLDPKLQVTVVDDKLTTDAEDPWGTQYTITYSEPENTRGKIIITSAGADRTVGTDDDYNIVIEYSITSNGGSVNIEFVEGRLDGITPPAGDGEGGSGGEVPVVLAAGVYDAEDNLLADWETLTKPVAEGGLYGMDVTTDYVASTYKTITTSPYYVLTNNFSGTTKIVFGNEISKIGNNAFTGCSFLTDVIISDSITSIGDYAFNACTNLANIKFSDSMLSIGKYAFNNCKGLTDVVIPNSVTSIDNNAFSRCSKLASITLSNGISSISSETFAYCDSLSSIVIPDSVTSIGSYAFSDCTSLTDVTLSNNLNSIGSYAFDLCKSLETIVIPNSVTTIGSYAFLGCESLASITLFNNLRSIQDYAFRQCTSLTNITIPDSVTHIGKGVFYGCTSLTDILFPSGITTINESTFQGCTSLENINIPVNITSIGHLAFSGCTKLNSVTLIRTTPPSLLSDSVFSQCSALTAIYVLTEKVDEYRSASRWSAYADIIQAIPTT